MKGSARPLLGASGAGAASSPPLVVQSSRSSSQLCIGLLVLCLLLQLYIISLWMAPPQTIHTAAAVDAPRTVGGALATPALSVIQEERRRASEVNTLPDSSSALTALQLLQKYIRMHQKELDNAGLGGAAAQIAGPKPHAHAPPRLRTPIGPGPVLGAHEHAAGESHAAGDNEHEHHAEDDHDESYLVAHPELYHQIWLNISAAWAEDMLSPERHHRIAPEEAKVVERCVEMQTQYNIRVDESWGTTPLEQQKEFDALSCSDRLSFHRLAKYIQAHPEQYDRPLAIPDERDQVKAEAGFEDKVIAIIASLTTRGVKVEQPEDLALFRHLLPSLVATAETGFEYWFYIGYDLGDPWFDNSEHRTLAREWFDKQVAQPLNGKGIVAKLVFAKWTNPGNVFPSKNPGPAFNYVTGVAYADGATWIYRINDDVRFDSPWASAFVSQLEAWGPPYGVVGPNCGQGATRILVVDFTHRTHHDIFPMHYPPTLVSWWLDDWITQVYGKQRTKRIASAKLTHLTSSHGQRYNVQMGGYYRAEIQRGRKVIEEYLAHTPGMKQRLAEYKQDVFAYHIRR